MGFGFGYTADMINRVKQNRQQLSSNRPKFKENNRGTIHSSDKKSQEYDFKTLSEKELEKVKTEVRKRTKLEQKRKIIIYGIIILCLTIVLMGIIMKIIN